MDTSYGRRAAIYARYSSHNQREESIEIQVERARAYCAENGLAVVGEYCDYAQTGRTTDRAEFQRMLADARRHLFDYVVVWKVTRIMRNRDEMAMARIMLRRSRVELLYAGEQITEGSSGVLQLGMLEVLAEYESALDSERIREGIRKNAERCMANGQPMFGWDIVDGAYVVNASEARALRHARDVVMGGGTMADAARSMSAFRGKRGSRITQSALTKLLRRRQNCGTYSYAGVTVEGGMPPLWSVEEQDALERLLADSHRPHAYARGDGSPFALTGRLRCARCGRPMAGTCGTSKAGRRYSYYRCPSCRATVRRELVEDSAVGAVISATADPSVRDRVCDLVMACESERSCPKQSEAIRKELREIDLAYGRIWDAIEAGIAPPGGKERIDALRARQDALNEALAAALAVESVRLERDRIEFWLLSLARVPSEAVLSTFVAAAWYDKALGEVRVMFTFDDSLPPDLPPDPGDGGTVFELVGASSTMRPPDEHPSVKSVYAVRRGFVVVASCERPR